MTNECCLRARKVTQRRFIGIGVLTDVVGQGKGKRRRAEDNESEPTDSIFYSMTDEQARFIRNVHPQTLNPQSLLTQSPQAPEMIKEFPDFNEKSHLAKMPFGLAIHTNLLLHDPLIAKRPELLQTQQKGTKCQFVTESGHAARDPPKVWLALGISGSGISTASTYGQG